MKCMTTPVVSINNPEAVYVAGADLDPALVSMLTPGDKLLVEINGVRMLGGNSAKKCPLVADRAWEVVSNEPPTAGQVPTTEHQIVLSHPDSDHFITLCYANLLHLIGKCQPAVFLERDANISMRQNGTPNPIYVILQFVSHYLPVANINKEFTPYDRSAARIVLGDDEFKRITITKWNSTLQRFGMPSWRHRSVCRLATRAAVSVDIIDAIKNGDWEKINKISMKSLYQLHEAIHWTPSFINLQSYAVSRVTLA